MLCSGFLSDKWPFFGSFLSYVVHLISCSNSSDDDTNKLLYCISLLLARGTGYIIKVAVLILTTDTFPEPDLHLTQNFTQGREGRKNGWTFFRDIHLPSTLVLEGSGKVYQKRTRFLQFHCPWNRNGTFFFQKLARLCAFFPSKKVHFS